jgi:hypothetical protein
VSRLCVCVCVACSWSHMAVNERPFPLLHTTGSPGLSSARGYGQAIHGQDCGSRSRSLIADIVMSLLLCSCVCFGLCGVSRSDVWTV